jgi:hypothetical protein
MKLKNITLRAYKSIAKLEAFDLLTLAVVIGAGGATDNFNIGDRTSRHSPSKRGNE